MKKSNTFIIIVLLIALLTNPVFGYYQNSIDLANTTQSDQNIEIISHLIELDAARFELQDRLYVSETILFNNSGTKIFSGAIKTWVPDGVEEIKVTKAIMMAETEGQPLVTVQNGNIISWQDYIEANDHPMYKIEYILSAEPKGTITKSKYYSKKLLYLTLINYKYSPSPGYPVFILKVAKSRDSSITVLDENRNKIIAQDVSEEDSSIISRFFEIQFKEFNIEILKTSFDLSQIAIYLIIGLLIVLVLTYPIIRKKSPKLQETVEEVSEEEPEEEESTPENEDLSGKTNDELKTEKIELLSKLKKLKKDYASGDLIDEEYEELRNSYQEKLKKIERKIE